MSNLTVAEMKSAIITWQNLDNRLNKQIESSTQATDEIQKDVAKELKSIKKRTAFCLFMGQQKTIDGTVCSRLQTCINKPNTQRYILNVAKDKPLTQRVSIRTASKELLNPKYKLGGKAIVNQTMIDQKGVYHAFKWDIPKAKKPTGTTATQKVVKDFDYTKEDFLTLVNSGKIKFSDA